MGGTSRPHGICFMLCFLVTLPDLANLANGEISLSPFQLKSDGEPTDGTFCPPSFTSPSSSKAATTICNMRGRQYYKGSAADLMLAARFGGMMRHGAGLWDLKDWQAPAPFTTEPNIPNMVADYVVELGQEQNKWNSAKKIQATAQVDLLLCSSEDCGIVVDIWNHDEYTVTTGFTTVLGSTSAIPQGFITPDTHIDKPNVVPVQQSTKDDSGPRIYQVQWGSNLTHSVKWLNKQAWGTRIPQGLESKVVRALKPYVSKMNEQRAADEWKRAYSQTEQAPDVMQYGAMSALLAAGNDKVKFIGYAAVQAKVLARARGCDPEADEHPFANIGHKDTEGVYGMPVTDECVVVIFPRHEWMSQHGWEHFKDNPCMRKLASVDDALNMPVYLFDSYFYQSEYFWVPTWLGHPLRRAVLQNLTLSTVSAGYTSDYCDQSHPGSGCHDFNISISRDRPWELLRHNNKFYMHQGDLDVYATAFDAHSILTRTSFGTAASDRPLLGLAPHREKQMDPYQGLGHYGTTLKCGSEFHRNSMLRQSCTVATQAAAGCFTDCSANKRVWGDETIEGVYWYDCGGCTALQVGGASVAAWELTITGSILHPRAEYIPNTDRLLQLTEVATWDTNTTPWCIDFHGYTDSKLLPLISELQNKVPADISEAIRNVSQSCQVCGLYKHDVYEGGRCSQVDTSGLTPVCLEYEYLDSFRGHLFNQTRSWTSTQCLNWDSLGIGFVGGSGAVGASNLRHSEWDEGLNQTAYPPLWALLRVQMHNISSDHECQPGVSHGGQCFIPFAGHGELHPSVLNQSIGTVVRDAQMFLKGRAQSELATMDTTMTWVGSLVDASVLLVAVVAMASGLHGLTEWLDQQCHKFPTTKPLPDCITRWCSEEVRQWCEHSDHTINKLAVTGLSCVLVLLGLMTAPIVTVVCEQMARRGNVDGSSSDLTWLAVDTDSGTGPYVVLAAVSVNLRAEYDVLAVYLTWINLGMAAAATLCLWYKILWPSSQGARILPIHCIASKAHSLWQFAHKVVYHVFVHVVWALKRSIHMVPCYGRRLITQSTSKSLSADGIVIPVQQVPV